jgi:hypothetical protein
MLSPWIIADMRSGDECGGPDHPGLQVSRTNAACVFFYSYRASDGALHEIKPRDQEWRPLYPDISDLDRVQFLSNRFPYRIKLQCSFILRQIRRVMRHFNWRIT